MPTGHPLATIQRERLAEAIRHVIDAVVTMDDATEEQLGTAADMTEAAARHLGREPRADDRGVRRGRHTDHTDYLVRSPIVGTVSALAPPFEWEFTDGEIRMSGTYHAAYEGPPGYVHGGWIALTFDELLGMTNVINGHPGMTGRLTLRYRKPTPLHRTVELRGWTEAIEGRRIVAKGVMTVDGTVTAEAEGLFLTIPPEVAAQYFRTEVPEREDDHRAQ